jgi:hypothetical protein
MPRIVPIRWWGILNALFGAPPPAFFDPSRANRINDLGRLSSRHTSSVGLLRDADMATFSKRTNQAGEVTHQAKCRRRGFRTVSKTFQTLADAKKWARSVERAWDSGEVPTSDEPQRPSTTLADVLRRYREEVAPTHKGCEIEVLGINALLRDYRAFADTPICDCPRQSWPLGAINVSRRSSL